MHRGRRINARRRLQSSRVPNLHEHRWRAPKAVRGRALVHFPVRFRSIRGWTTARANYFNPSTNTARVQCRSRPFRARLYSSTCRRDQVWAPARCMPTPQNTRCNRIASTGRIMVIGPAVEFGTRAPIEDEGRGITWGRDKYTVRRKTFTAARNTVYRLVQIFRDHIPNSPSPLRLPSRYINILSSSGVSGYLRGSELPRRIHRFIMLRIPSADNHVLRATRFAWNSGSFGLTRKHYMHNTTRCIPFAQN